MAVDLRVYDNEHGDPVVVMVTTGTFDVSRLAGLLAQGRCEDGGRAKAVNRALSRHNGGVAALRLLAAHGGPDLLERVVPVPDNPDLAKAAPGPAPDGLLHAVTLAIGYPGSFAGVRESGGESVPDWKARAVLEAVRPWLAGPGPEQMVREFNAGAEQAGHGYSDTDLALRLVGEEVQELHDAIAAEDPVAIADAAADVVYNAVGIAVARGIPFDAVLAEVHRSNMTKLIPPIARREDGKIVKGPRFEPPDIARVLGLEASDG